MKQFFTLFIAILCTFLFVSAQQVEREEVILEIGTGTWCQYCPGAAMGADDLIENGCDVGVIEYHNGDAYTNSYSNARNTYYGITGYPTAHFDGVLEVIGGSTNQSMYTTYLPRYNQRKAINSSFTIQIEFSNTGLNYTAIVYVTKVAPTASTNMVLHFVLTESHIMINWQGQDHLNFVERLMVPDQFGTDLDFSGGDIQTVTLNFTMDPGWVKENCELVAFIQDTDDKEILQGVKKTMATPDFDYDAEIINIYNVPNSNCSGEISPIVTIQNWGAEVLTSLDINYKVNYGDVTTYQWTGSLDFLAKETVDLTPISFPVVQNNAFIIYASNPNGQVDENPTNDTITKSFETAVVTTYYRVALLLKTDANPQQSTYEVKNSSGDILYTGGGFTQPNHVYKDTFNLYNSDCYRFFIYDSGGDGLVGGFYTLREAIMGGNSLANGSTFTTVETAEFVVDWVGIAENNIIDQNLRVYPNPLEDITNVYFNLNERTDVTITIYDGSGKVVYVNHLGVLGAGEQSVQLQREDLSSGINFIQVNAGSTVYSKKVLVNN